MTEIPCHTKKESHHSSVPIVCLLHHNASRVLGGVHVFTIDSPLMAEHATVLNFSDVGLNTNHLLLQTNKKKYKKTSLELEKQLSA